MNEVKFSPFSRGQRVRVSPEGLRNGIAVRRRGIVRVGTVIRSSGDSIDVKWDGNRGIYSIHATFIEVVP